MRGPQTQLGKMLLTGGVLLAVALVPRLDALGSEHVDIAEFLTMVQPRESTLMDYLWRLWMVGPDQVPLYYVFTWAVRNVFGYSWLVTRFASTALMLLVLLLAWRMVANRFGERAGLLTGLLLALSPADVYYSIQARSYSLVIFEAAISIWSLTRAVETGKRRWWALNLLVNNLLPWTHLFGFLLIGAQGLWLLGMGYSRRPAEEKLAWRAWHAAWRGALWGLGHAPAIVLAIAWILRGTAGEVAWYAPAPPMQILTDLLGDMQYFGNLFVYESAPGQPVFDFSAAAIRNSTDYQLAWYSDLVVGIGAVVALASAAWYARKLSGTLRAIAALLFMTALLPPIFLYAGAALTLPVALPRYTAYCNFPLFMLFGVGLAHLPVPRRAAYALVTAMLAALWILCDTWDRVEPEVDWPGVVEMLHESVDDDARVVALSFSEKAGVGTRLHRRMLEYSDPTRRDRYRHAFTVAGAVDYCAVECARTGRAAYVLTYALPSAPEKEKRLLAMLRNEGFRVETRHHQYFTLYKAHHQSPPKTWLEPADSTAREYLQLITPYLQGPLPAPEYVNAALRWAIEDGDDLASPDVCMSTTNALLAVCPTLARAGLAYELAAFEDPAASEFTGMLLAMLEGDEATMREYARNMAIAVGAQGMRPVAEALAAGDMARAREIAATRRYVTGVVYTPVFYQVLGIEERLPYAEPLKVPLP